jgi:hypothetical protein
MVIHEPGGVIEHGYFPTSSIVSVLCPLAEGTAPEVTVIGFDGVVGVAALMGAVATTNTRAVVQSAGHGFRIRASSLQSAIDHDAVLRNLLLRYAMAVQTQMAQIGACNRFHGIEQQVCRLLLMCHDRWVSNRLSLTHERMANLLGVRREGVTVATGKLAAAGLISYHRGCVTLLDRAAMQVHACECHAVIKLAADALLPVNQPNNAQPVPSRWNPAPLRATALSDR